MGERKDSLRLRPDGRRANLLDLSLTHSLIHTTERLLSAKHLLSPGGREGTDVSRCRWHVPAGTGTGPGEGAPV